MVAFLKVGYNSIPRLSSLQSVANFRDQIFSDVAAYSASRSVFWPKFSVETLDGNNGISAITDIGPSGNNGSQAVSANRPQLSRSDTLENLFKYSQQWSQVSAWTRGGITPLDNAAIAPDGTTTATKLTKDDAGSSRSINQGVTINAQGIVEFWISAGTFTSANFGALAGSWLAATAIILEGPGSVSGPDFMTISGLTSAWTKIRLTTNSSNAGFQFFLYPGGAGSGSSGAYLYVWQAQARRAGTSSDLVLTTTVQEWSGINLNKTLILDGSNDSIDGTYLPVIAGGFTIVAHIRKFNAVAAAICSCYNNTAQNRLWFFVSATGVLSVRIWANATDYIERSTAAGAIVVNTDAIVSFTYDGTTAATGIKIYLNGVQVDTTTASAGGYAVPAVSTYTLNIGRLNTSDYFTGAIGFFAAFVTALSAVNRAEVEALASYNFLGTTRPFISQSAASDIFPVSNLYAGGSTVYWRNSATVVTAKSTFKLGIGSDQAMSTVNYFAIRGLNLMFKAGSGNVTVNVYGFDNNYLTAGVLLLTDTISESELRGPFLEDYLYEGSLSAAYRYFSIEIISQYECVHRLRKLYIGTLFDFGGRSPYYPYVPGYGDNGSPFTSDAGSIFKTSVGRRPRQLQFNWRGIKDTDRVFFDENVKQYLTDYPIFLYEIPSSDHKPLNDDGVVFGWADSEIGTKDWKNNNQISLSLREDIVG